MKSAFHETGKTKEVIDRNYGFIDNKGAPPIKYVKSWVCLCAESWAAAVPAAAQLSLPVRLRIGKLPRRLSSSSSHSSCWRLWRAQCCCLQTTQFKLRLPDGEALTAPKGHICESELIFSLRRDLRFIEVVENVCQRLLEYNLHKERGGSNRFAKVRQSVWSIKAGFPMSEWAWTCSAVVCYWPVVSWGGSSESLGFVVKHERLKEKKLGRRTMN